MELNKNIYENRKLKGYSQEDLAKKINVSRQTISNWELGDTSPNPEQLLLLSKLLEKSVDELLGNDINYKNQKEEKRNSIYLGTTIIGGVSSGVWAFTANRFNYSEMAVILIAGAAIGYGVGLVINGILKKYIG